MCVRVRLVLIAKLYAGSAAAAAATAAGSFNRQARNFE